MKTAFKKIASLLICLCLIISGMVITASAAESTATISFSSTSNRTSVSTSKQVWEQNGITFTNNKGSGSNINSQYYNPLRLYKNSNIVIEFASEITKIEFTANTTAYATSLGNSIGSSQGEVVVSSKTVTFTPTTPATSFTFTISDGQTRIDSVKITYTVAEGGGEGNEGGNEGGGETPDPENGSTLTIAEALALGATKADGVYTTNKYYITGEITEVANTTYGNMTIKDADNNTIYIYGTKNADGTVSYDGLDNKPDAGDVITVLSVVGNFGGTAQLKEAWITAHTDNNPVTPDPEEPAGDKEAVTNTYKFSNYTAGTQYANETLVLDDEVSVSTYLERCHFTTQLRIYGKTDTQSAGYAVLSAEREITALSINAGYKATTVNVYVSSNGSDWNSTNAVVSTSTSYKDYTITIPAGTKFVKFEATDAQIRIASMTVSLAAVKAPVADMGNTSVDVKENLTVNQEVTVKPEDIEGKELLMHFTMNGATTTVPCDPSQIVDNKFTFTFDNIGVQCMADEITAKLVTVENDKETEQATATFSVKAYAKAVLETSTDAATKKFVSDMLRYGAAAQVYQNHTTNGLATDGLDTLLVEGSSTEVPEGCKMALTKSASTDIYFKGATVRFDNVNSLVIRLSSKTANTKVLVNDVEATLVGNDCIISDLKATDYATTYIFKLYEGDELIQTLTYGINSYAFSKQTSSNDAMAALAKALYAYGVSASESAN